MKTTLKYPTIVALAVAALSWPLLNVVSTEEEDPVIVENPSARDAFRRLQLQDENGEIPPNGLMEALDQKNAMPYLPEAWGEFLQGGGSDVPGWISIGPGNVGGRVRSLIIHPINPAIMWAGSVSGGIWKTINGGTSWSTNTDFLPNLAVNCMVMDPTNPNTLYAGTGEGFFILGALQGKGIFKTTDGGTTWRQLPFPADDRWINRLAISPTNSQLLLAGTQFGLFRSTNGGEDWQAALGTWGILDVRFRPNNGSADLDDPQALVKCIAGTRANGAYFSTNDGQSWALATGLPASPERVEVAYSRSNPSIVYASVAVDQKLYKSINGGATFSLAGSPPGGTTVNFHANSLWVDPTNPNRVLVGGFPALWRTTDGGATGSWTRAKAIHPDQHVIVEHPGYNGGIGGTPNTTVYVGNDGGVYQTSDVLSSSFTWTNLNHNLAITQFYGGAGNVATGTIIGGSQDNGSVRFRPADGPENWTTVFGGDAGFCAADQTDSNYFYTEEPNLKIYRSTNGAGFNSAQYIWDNPPNGIPKECGGPPADHPCADFIAPFVLDPNNPNTILAGGKSLWRSTNVKAPLPSQVSWAGIKPAVGAENNNISAIAVAPDNSNIICVGYNDGSVYYTTNGTASPPTWILRDNGLPNRRCTRITIGRAPQTDDPLAPRKMYATFGAFKQSNVWKTENSGQGWTPIHNNLPSAPVRSLVISPSNANTLYVGTEVGVFASTNGGQSWSPGAPNVPGPANVSVDELFWMNNKLVAVTYGRGMFTIGPQIP